jgi:hypothetical protein
MDEKRRRFRELVDKNLRWVSARKERLTDDEKFVTLQVRVRGFGLRASVSVALAVSCRRQLPPPPLLARTRIQTQIGKTVWQDAPRKMRVELWLSALQRKGAGVEAAQQYRDLLAAVREAGRGEREREERGCVCGGVWEEELSVVCAVACKVGGVAASFFFAAASEESVHDAVCHQHPPTRDPPYNPPLTNNKHIAGRRRGGGRHRKGPGAHVPVHQALCRA